MNKVCLTILFFSLSLTSLLAQTPQENSKDLVNQAVFKIEDKLYAEAIILLDSAIKEDPEAIDAVYQKTFCLHLLEKNQEAIILMEKLIATNKKADGSCYQLLGNVYDASHQSDKAIEVYNKGISIFPKDGSLYLEKGVVYAGSLNKVDQAVEAWEKGVENAPTYASNYYYLSKVYCNTNKKVWGLLYGEIFLNLERRTVRSAEIGKLIYDTYRKCISVLSSKKVELHFIPETISKDKHAQESFILSFHQSWLPGVKKFMKSKSNLDMAALVQLRKEFIKTWFKNGKNKLYPNAVFDYQNSLLDSNYFDSYSYWVLFRGKEDEFSPWLKNNKEQFSEFAAWFVQHPMPISEENRVWKGMYK